MKVLIYLRRRAGKSLVLFLLPMMLASCSGSTNSTGPAPPLPTGQNGSLELWNVINNTGCYVPDGTNTCSAGSTGTTGTSHVTALATQTVSASSLYLLVGDDQGNVYAWNASSTPSSPVTCSFSFSAGTSVNGLASVSSSGTTYVYAVAGSSLKVNLGATICAGTSIPTISPSLAGTTVGLAVANNYIYGVNSAGQYFSVAAGASTLTQSPTTLPNLPSTATIGGVTADRYGIVFVTDYANSAIYAYYASNGTLTRINGTLTGNVDVTNPKAITTVYAPTPTSTGCTTGSCEFLYVTNYSQAVVQFVLSFSGSGTSFSVGYTEFNAPYTSCEIINPVAMTSFLNVVSPSISNTIPYVYIGENGSTTSSSCFGETTFGNNVTAYNLSGE
ncbi:MAG: hypothetical protein ACYCR5_08625 [Leptospirillum sp.]